MCEINPENMTLRPGMQLPTVMCACAKLRLCPAKRSMFGVVPGSLQPKAPTESALMSSTVMIKIFTGAACNDTVKNNKMKRICFMR